MRYNLKSNIILSVLLACTMAFASCSGVKGLAKPDLQMPSAFMDSPTTDSLSIADMDWWEFFTDEPLREIIMRTLENKRDMLKAQARVDELRALYGVEKVNMLPEITGTVGADHETNNYHGDGVDKDPEFDLKLSVGWEINLWGALTLSLIHI